MAPTSQVALEIDSLLDGFLAAARRYPHEPAVRHGDTTVSYADLDARADALAARLRAAGSARGDRIAILLTRSPDLVIAAVATLKVGACYVPIDPANPADRIGLIVADAAPRLVITSHPLAGRVPDGTSTLCLDDEAPSLSDVEEPTSDVGPEDCAYVIFTSGTTGRPKGVAVSHRNVLQLFAATRPLFGFGSDDVWSMTHSFAFDFSVWEIWGALLHGGRVVIVPDDVVRDPAALRRLLRDEGVTMLSQTPTAFGLLVAEETNHTDRLPLRHVVLGGEALRFPDLAAWLHRYGEAEPRLTNMYGITETTVHASYRPVRQADLAHRASLIGEPLPGYGFVLVDADLTPVPPGDTGEIVVTGPGVALGYLGRPELTRQRFVELPDGAGGVVRGYRSGDLARRRADGDHEYVGRSDDQVKIRGYRIELGEVEAALARQPSVRAAAVAVRTTPEGERALVAYVVPAGEDRDVRRLRTDLAATVPGYMLPGAVMYLDALPLTPNGKLDRDALPVPDRPATAPMSAPMATPVAASAREELLCELFGDALGRPAVGPDDDFLELGGHSLTAIRLTNRVRKVLGLEVGIKELFDARTPRALAARTDSGIARAPLTRHRRPAELPLSYAQQRLWFLHQLYGATPANHLPYALHLTGRVDTAALAAALGDVVARHEVLRTVYPERDGEPHQRVLPARAVALPVTEVAEDEVAGLVREAARAGFNLTTDLPVRARLLVTGPTRSVLVLVLHHIAADGWSLGPLLDDLATAYAARLAGLAPEWTPLPVQYADYALWQQELFAEDGPDTLGRRQLDFWTDYLRGAPQELDLPTDRSRRHTPSFQGGVLPLDIDEDLHRRLVALGRAAGTTMTMVLQATVAALLTWHGAGTDLPMAVPTAGRADEALHPLVGYFVNTLVTRVDTGGDPAFAELLRRVRVANLAAYDHQDLPFERLVEAINPERSAARHPLTQVAVGTQPGVPSGYTLPGLVVAAEPVHNNTVRFDLAFRFEERRDPDGTPRGVTGSLEYSTDLFADASARLVADRFLRLLRLVADRPDVPVGDLDLVGPDEHRLLAAWNDTAAPEYDAPTAGVLIERQTDATPGATAIVAGDTRWTYRELDERANRIAHVLRELGVGAEDMVALGCHRGPWFVAAMLGVWKAGAAYTPLELRDPAERLAFMVRDSGARVVLTDADALADLPMADGVNVIRLDDDPLLAAAPATRPPDVYDNASAPSERLAYAVYTSGSTGRPKCVLIQHRGVLCRLRDVVTTFGLTAADTNLQVISLGVEVPVREICGPLLVGGTVAMLPPLGERDPGIVVDTIRRARPTLVMCAVHSLLESLLAYGADAEDFASVRLVGTGGEVLHPAEAEVIMRSWGCALVNQYGPTETTMMCSHHSVVPDDLDGRIPIGRPLSNTTAYVLDQRLRPVPIGVTGEVYLGGICIARGFHDRPGLTAERFVADPFGPPGTRMYRSGDLARWRPDGNLVFVGRIDSQVKIRGYRVEIGEVESAVAEHPAVARAAVVQRVVGPGDSRLAGYVIAEDAAGPPTPGQLRDYLAQRLPDQMVPTTFTVLDAFPLLPNGKLDRARLPEPDVAEQITARGPRTPHEELLCTLFAEVLSLPRVGIDNDFFQLGGHSLLAARLIGRVRAQLGMDLALRTLFEAPTVAALARRLADDTGNAVADAAAALEVVLPLRPNGSRPPLFCVHPGGGLGWGYAKILRHLDTDIPVHAIQAHGLLHPDAMPDSVEAMAAHYVERIRQVQPSGPYHLLGWSLGGMVAYEMARQLRAEGVPIAFLALLDCYPGMPDHFRVGDRAMLRSLIDPDRVNAVPEQGSIEFATAMEIIRQDTGALASLTEPQVEAMLKTMAHNRKIVRTYDPGCFDGDVLFFMADRDRVPDAPTAAVWEPLVAGTIETHSVDSTHMGMFDTEPAAHIGRIVAAELDGRHSRTPGAPHTGKAGND